MSNNKSESWQHIFNEIKEALKEIEEGKGISMEEVVAEMEAKYNYNEEL